MAPFQCWPLGNFANSIACVYFVAPNAHKAHSRRLLLPSTVSRAAEKWEGNNVKQCRDASPVANLSFAINTTTIHLKNNCWRKSASHWQSCWQKFVSNRWWYIRRQQFMILALLCFMGVLEWVMVFSRFFSTLKPYQIHSNTEFNTALVLHYKSFIRSRPLNWLPRECRWHIPPLGDTDRATSYSEMLWNAEKLLHLISLVLAAHFSHPQEGWIR